MLHFMYLQQASSSATRDPTPREFGLRLLAPIACLLLFAFIAASGHMTALHAGEPAPVEVVTEIIGEGPTVPIEDRLVPILVLLAVALATIFLPAASLLQEREKGTIGAVLTTPAHVGDVLLAKGAIGFVVGIFTGLLTLALNLGLQERFWANLAIIVVATIVLVRRSRRGRGTTRSTASVSRAIPSPCTSSPAS